MLGIGLIVHWVITLTLNRRTKETLPSNNKGSTEDLWVALAQEYLRVFEMTLTIRKPSGPTGDPFVALKTELGKTVLLFEVTLKAAVNMFPSINDIDAAKPKQQ